MPSLRERWSAMLSASGGHDTAAMLLRFVLSGGVNTLATLLLYWLLLGVMPAQPAYAISFVAGIVVSYLLNTAFVFNARRSWRGFFSFPLVYLVCYLAGALVLEIATRRFHLSSRIAPLFSIAVTLPLTFLLMRAALRLDRRES